MSEISARLIKKNNISAYLFLVTAILCSIALAFFVFVFALIFGSINALFFSLGGNSENSFHLAELWQLYLFAFVSAAAIILQVAAFGFVKTKSPYGRIAGIGAFALTLLVFTPFALVLIYPFAFLVGNEGKYLYQSLKNK